MVDRALKSKTYPILFLSLSPPPLPKQSLSMKRARDVCVCVYVCVRVRVCVRARVSACLYVPYILEASCFNVIVRCEVGCIMNLGLSLQLPSEA